VSHRSLLIAIIVLLLGLVLPVLYFVARSPDTVDSGQTPQGVSADDIREHNRGVGLMGKYDFPAAVDVFEKLVDKYPSWQDARVNYAIGLLNRSRPDTKDLERALGIMLDVVEQDPDDLRAQHCAGLILRYRGRIELALPYFEHVAEADGSDPFSAYFLAACYRDMDKVKEAIAWYEKALARDPTLRSAYHALFQALRWEGRDDEAQEMFEVFQKLEDHPQARVAEIKYTRMGPHGMARTVDLPGAKTPPTPQGPIFLDPVLLAFESPSALTWKVNDPLSSITAADIDGDGATDLFFSSVLAGERPNLVLLRRGDGFEADLSHPLASPPNVRTALFGDFNNDGRLDAYLCCRGTNFFFHTDPDGEWNETSDPGSLENRQTTDGAMVDIDHDGDLDLVLIHDDDGHDVWVNTAAADATTWKPMPDDAGLLSDGRPGKGLVLGDFDHDRDLDILLLHDEGKHEVFINDRLWNWRTGAGFEALLETPARAGIALDADADGQTEIYLATAAGILRWVPDENGVWKSSKLGAVKRGDRWVHLGTLDADGDGALELLVNDGGGPRLISPIDGTLRFGKPEQDLSADPRCVPYFWSAERGMALVGLSPSGAPVIWMPGPGRHRFVGLSFSGKHKDAQSMRSNADGIGTRAAARVDSKWTVHSTYRRHSGPGQSLQPICIGLAGEPRVDFVDLLWTDGLLQTEDTLEPDRLYRVEEIQRQTSSCPVLFAWDGSRFAFVSDILGVGGLGFWVAPHTYAPATPRESFLLPQGLLQARGEEYVLKIGEPMEEGCYLDSAVLEVYDLPPGWKMTIDERMQIEGPAPTGDVIFYRREANPVKAVDRDGKDVLPAISKADRKAAEAGTLDRRFIGRTSEQVLTLTFGESLDAGTGRPVLVTDGWIEYPYAQTMFAAWQAGATYDAPTVEAKGADGKWQVVLKNYGYPAGMPRQSSVPLAGLPKGTRQLRIRTNQEIYWDRIFVAYAQDCPTHVNHALGRPVATLAETGFARRTTNHQRLPHYDYARRAPLWNTRHQAGWYTKFGDVYDLLRETDDALVVFGPGEEVELRFDAVTDPLETGWTRHHVLKTTGWCKDMDLFTKDGETIGPLPTRQAADAPDPKVKALHEQFQTRYCSGR